MNDATLAQGNQVMNLILQKRMPAKNLQQLLASGLQSMLLDACNESNLATVNPFEFRRFLGLTTAEVMPYGIGHKFTVEGVASMDSFIDQHLKGFEFDRKPLKKERSCHSLARTNPFDKRLYAVEESLVKYAQAKLSKANIAPVSVSDLVKFAFLNPTLEGWISATVIGLGSYWNNGEEGHEYPFIRYEHGKLTSCGRIRSDTMISNGYPDVSHRFFFLGVDQTPKGGK